MEDSEAGCSVCQEGYQEGCRPPRNLGCGHSVCTSCVEQIISRGRRCPECRRPFAATTATALPINYPLLRLARVLATRGEANPTPSPPPQENYNDAGECAAHVSRLSQRCMTCRVWVCGECILVDHELPPRGKCRVVPLRQALALMKQTDAEPLTAMCRDIQTLRQGLVGQANKLEAARKTHETTAINLRSVLSAEQDVIQDLEGRRKAVMDRVAEVDTWTAGLRQVESTMTASATVRQLATAKLAARDSMASTESKIKRERQRQPPGHIPHSLAGPQDMRGILRLVSNMVVVQEEGGRGGREEEPSTNNNNNNRWGRLSLQDNLLYLYALRPHDNPPPASAPTFTLSSVKALLPRSSGQAFLDLRWGSQTQGRVIIKTHGRTPRARQFLQLCSGETGPSYLNTRVFQADRIGGEGAIVRFGDYENNDGTGGAGLLSGITDGGDYLKEATPGLVVGAHSSQQHRLAVCGVILSSWARHSTDTAFAEVTQGLGVLLAAVTHNPITEVEVDDCGLIIPL